MQLNTAPKLSVVWDLFTKRQCWQPVVLLTTHSQYHDWSLTKNTSWFLCLLLSTVRADRIPFRWVRLFLGLVCVLVLWSRSNQASFQASMHKHQYSDHWDVRLWANRYNESHVAPWGLLQISEGETVWLRHSIVLQTLEQEANCLTLYFNEINCIKVCSRLSWLLWLATFWMAFVMVFSLCWAFFYCMYHLPDILIKIHQVVLSVNSQKLLLSSSV